MHVSTDLLEGLQAQCSANLLERFLPLLKVQQCIHELADCQVELLSRLRRVNLAQGPCYSFASVAKA